MSMLALIGPEARAPCCAGSRTSIASRRAARSRTSPRTCCGGARLLDRRSRRSTATTLRRSRSTVPRALGGGLVGVDALRERRVKDIFLRKRVLRSPGSLQRHYDVVIVGGGSHGLATAYYLAQAPRHHERRDPREELHRLRRRRAEHDDHPRELPHARGRGVLQGERQALREALGRARLQPHVLAARPLHARALRPLARRPARAGRGEQAPRDRQPRDRPQRGQGALSADQHRRGRDVADPGRALPPAGRDHPPRRRRLGLREAGRPRRRSTSTRASR